MMSRDPVGATGDVRGGTLEIYFAKLLVVPSAFATAVILARSLGPHAFGQLVLASTLIMWLEWLCGGGLGPATIRAVAAAENPRTVAGQAARAHLLAGLLGMGVVVALATPAAELMGDARLADYLLQFSPMLPLSCLAGGLKATLVGLSRYRENAWLEAVRWGSRLALMAMLAAMGLSVTAAIAASVAAAALQMALAWRAVRPPLRATAGSGGLRPWSAAAGLVPSAILMKLLRLDIVAVQAARGAAQAGQYGLARTAVGSITMLLGVLSATLLPKLTAQCRCGMQVEARQSARQAFRVIWLLLPVMAILSSAAEQVVVPIFGDGYREAAAMLRWLAFGGWAIGAVSLANGILARCLGGHDHRRRYRCRHRPCCGLSQVWRRRAAVCAASRWPCRGLGVCDRRRLGCRRSAGPAPAVGRRRSFRCTAGRVARDQPGRTRRVAALDRSAQVIAVEGCTCHSHLLVAICSSLEA